MDAEQGTAEGHQHRSARERQRRGPMFGCLRWLVGGTIVFLLLLVLIVGGGWWYVGSYSFADLVARKIETTLESRLGRKVTIGSVSFDRAHLTRVVLNDLRIANSPGAVHPFFATVKQVTITGGIASFFQRHVVVNRVDITEPQMFFEIYPAGSPLVHNFPHWNAGPQSRYEIVHLDIRQLFIHNGGFDFLDRQHKIAADSNHLDAIVNVTSKEDLYAGTGSSPLVRMRIQDYKPFDMKMRSQFRYTPGVLELQSVALDGGPDLQVFLNGKFAPLTEGAYDLHLTSAIGLNRVRDIFAVNKVLDGPFDIDARLRGKAGTFTLAGNWASSHIRADVYDLTNARGKLNVTGDHTVLDVDKAQFDGGAITAHYVLPKYDEPYPMSVDARFNGISVEKLFADWGIGNTGLRGDATGTLAYHWKKDKVLEGGGQGTATLSKNATAFSNAKYPIPVAGSTDFGLDNGVITFRRADLQTDKTTASFTGTFRIDDGAANLTTKIHSEDFSELDRIGYNFAQSAGKKTYTLLGLAGAGDINGTIQGPLKKAEVVAHIAGTGVKYNNVLLGNGDIDLRYDGVHDTLRFDHAVFREGNGSLALSGTIGFPAKGPSPEFNLAIDATNYPVDRAVATVNLKLAVAGLGTGHLTITGTPDAGKVTFSPLTVTQANNAKLTVSGTTQWLPGKGHVVFDLAIDAQSFPVADIVKFLDLGTVPITGVLTGKLNLSGPKNELEGSGAITVRNGSVYGEPVTEASANVAFTKGTLKLTNLKAQGPAGSIAGQAELNLNTNQFNYSLESSSIDLSKIGALSSLAGLLGGKLTVTTTGAGTFDQPELVINATLNDATLKGLTLPAGSPPPSLYIAIRNGQLIVRGSIADLVTIDGTGSIAQDSTLSGNVQIKIPDVAKLLSISPNTAAVQASGAITANLQLGGKTSSLEALSIDATFPQFNVRVAEHEFTPVEPLHIALRNGSVVFDSFDLKLVGTESTFAVTGSAELTGTKRLNLDVRGLLEAALLQLFTKDVKADGHINIAAGLHGTMTAPNITGTAEFRDNSVRFAGIPQLIDHINGTLVFRGDRVDVEGLKANIGGGTVVAGGTVMLSGVAPQRVRLTLQGNDVTIRYFEGVSVQGDFMLQVAGDANRMTVQGDVTVSRGVYYKNVDIANAILGAVLSRRTVTPVVAASWQDHVALNVRLTSNETLAVRNNIADLTGGGDIVLNGTLANPVIQGEVRLDEGGKLRFQNVDYTLVRGTINFQNPFRIDPYFDITLEARVSGGTSADSESGPVDVTVNVTGTIDRITPTITSDPPTSDITLFSLLGLGGLTSRNVAGTATTAQPGGTNNSALLYQAAAGLLGTRVFPFVDSFSYDPGLQDTTPGPKFSFQKRISSDLTTYLIYNTLDQKTKVVVEWQVNPEWTLRFTRDDMIGTYQTEARYRRRYPGRWTWGHSGAQPVAMTARLQPDVPPPPPVKANEPVATPPGAPMVTSVSFNADSKFDTSVVEQYVTQHVGQPLSARQIQTSIKALYSTGDFRDVRVDSTPSAAGVALTFTLYVNYRVSDIRFEGLGGADRERATRDLTFRVGDVLSLNSVDRSGVAIQTFLNRSGFLEATVDPETVFNRQQSRASVIFHVSSGARAHVAQVMIEGDTSPFPSSQLIQQMHRGPGKAFAITEARGDADRMRTFLIHHNYRKAEVRFLNETYDSKTKQVTLHYRATSGPIVKVKVAGVPEKDVRGLVPFRPNQPYSEDGIARSVDDIITNYQAHGYFNAAVDIEEHLANNVWTITFNVKPGQQYHLTAVTFTGNQRLSEKKLADVIATSASGGFRSFLSRLFRRATSVTQTQLSSDRDALESYYLLNGFSEAQVATPVVTTKADGTMTVDFPITEGPQTIVAEVKVEGNQQAKGRSLPKLELKAGGPLNPQSERDDLIALQTFYADRGNVEVQVKPREEISADKTSAKVAYVVSEGPEVKVNQVVVRGNTYTESNVVARQSDIDRGDAFSYASILKAQRDLYQLGIFNRVDVQGESAGTSTGSRDVVISVEEGKNLSVAGSIGFDAPTSGNPSPLLSASIAHRNLFGTGRYAGLDAIVSKSRTRALLTYREPFIGPWQIPVQFTLYQNRDTRRDTKTQQRGSWVEASKVIGQQMRLSLRYEYRINTCIVQNPGDICDQIKSELIPGLDRSIANVHESSITPSLVWDRRDDPLDPHHGFTSSLSTQWAFPALAANAHFLKEFLQGSWFWPVSARSVFAMSARVGLIQDLGSHTTPAGDTLTGVPLSERFTAGGESSHRAYALDLLGTVCPDPADLTCKPTLIIVSPGDVAPIGGLGVFIANAEYRFPIFSSVQGAAFVDAGNTYADSTVHFGDLKYGVGTGVRYLSPVGPIRFDVGYKLKRQIIGFDTDTGKAIYERPIAYFITLGYAF